MSDDLMERLRDGDNLHSRIEAADEIASLRVQLARAEQAEDFAYDDGHEAGYRAGIEAAYKASGKYHQITHIREALRALAEQKGG